MVNVPGCRYKKQQANLELIRDARIRCPSLHLVLVPLNSTKKLPYGVTIVRSGRWLLCILPATCAMTIAPACSSLLQQTLVHSDSVITHQLHESLSNRLSRIVLSYDELNSAYNRCRPHHSSKRSKIFNDSRVSRSRQCPALNEIGQSAELRSQAKEVCASKAVIEHVRILRRRHKVVTC